MSALPACGPNDANQRLGCTQQVQKAASGMRTIAWLKTGEKDTAVAERARARDRKSTRLNSSHSQISYAVFCLKKKKNKPQLTHVHPLQRTSTSHQGSQDTRVWP